jgi:hypothetical protein
MPYGLESFGDDGSPYHLDGVVGHSSSFLNTLKVAALHNNKGNPQSRMRPDFLWD